MDIFVEDQEEVHSDQVDSKKNGEDTYGDDSALDWETTAASRVPGVLIGASAEAAAARGKFLFSLNRSCILWSFILHLFVTHHWGHFVHLFVVHIKFGNLLNYNNIFVRRQMK